MRLRAGRTALGLLPLLALCAGVAGCGSSESLSAQQVLQTAATTTANLKSVKLDIKFGAGFAVQGVDLVSATGVFRAPGDSDLLAKTRTVGGFLEPELLTSGGKIYFKAIQFQAFQELTPEQALQYPDVARLLDRDHGLAPAIARGRSARLDADEAVNSVECYKVEAAYGPAELNQAVAPLHLTDDIKVTLWVGRSDHLVRRVRLEGHLFTPDQSTSAEVHLHDFNGPVDIPSPA
ncbi:MAG TPA: LppX_LprAFG lipoprotein [Candidatus Solibacter sp.]|nr:LppX_LprAFG lipoprotein [Candidatus Solibacter sp.]